VTHALAAVGEGAANVAAGETESICERHAHSPGSVQVYLSGGRPGGLT
jgi:hypothetical protein